mgnify:FL=1
MSAPPPDPLPPARLRPRARMHLPGEFKRCLDAGQRMGGAFYRCSVRLDADREPRIGFAISRKVDKRAVVRNRLKRVARDTFRRHRHRLPAGDYVFMAKREAATADSAALHRDFERLLARLAALKPPSPQVTMLGEAPSRPAGTDSAAASTPSPTTAVTAQRPGDDRASE